MSVQLRPVSPSEAERLLPILKDADEDEERVRATLHDDRHVSYVAFAGEQLVGALTMRWDNRESEIIYIAVVVTLRKRGYGKAMLTTLLFDEASKHSTRSLLVGTADASLATIGFYLKSGFRMDYVRKDFFSYIQPPIAENGIIMRDMLVLKYELEE